MSDKYGSSVLLLNGQAVCYLLMAKYEDAESLLQEALDKVLEYRGASHLSCWTFKASIPFKKLLANALNVNC